MKTLFMTKGLPASGKSHWAKEQVALSKGRIKRVNKDDLRAMIDPKWSQGKEKAVITTRDAVIDSWLAEGYDVICDDTNFAPVHEQRLRALATKHSCHFRLVDFTDVSVETCLERDLRRPGAVGADVIMKMFYDNFIQPPPPVIDAPDCIICDLDGTIAESTGRGPFEETRVGEDRIRPFIWAAVNALARATNAQIIFLSGRQDSCREATTNWLRAYCRTEPTLYMRAAGDSRKDYVVKEKLYRTHIEGRYNVRAIFDDRPQVLRMWERIGLGDRLFRCGQTMREF
jgi:predicted kinase